MKDRLDVIAVMAAWMVLDAIVSIAISTDQYPLFTIGRAFRGLIGVLLLLGRLPGQYQTAVGAYLVLESVGSAIISPDKGELFFEIGWIVRIIAGLLLVMESGGRRKVG